MSIKVSKQNSRVNVQVDGVSWGTFDSRTGGEVSATVNKRRTGGMGAEETYAGLPTTSDVVVAVGYDLDRFLTKVQALRRDRRVGSARVVVTDQQLDEYGQNYGTPEVYSGRLSNLTPSEKDSTSSDPQLLTMTVVVETA